MHAYMMHDSLCKEIYWVTSFPFERFQKMTLNFDQMVPGVNFQNVIFTPKKSWQMFQVPIWKDNLAVHPGLTRWKARLPSLWHLILSKQLNDSTSYFKTKFFFLFCVCIPVFESFILDYTQWFTIDQQQ